VIREDEPAGVVANGPAGENLTAEYAEISLFSALSELSAALFGAVRSYHA
jgi:hypothetical protein